MSIYNVETMDLVEFKLKTSIGKWGNSPAIRIPNALMREAQLNTKQQVNISVSRGRIIIEPLRDPEYSLDELLSQITPANRHDEVDFGDAVGKEIF
jgi:antitoxin MazE